MRLLVTGSTGLIGTSLVRARETRGDVVIRLVRRPPAASSEHRWDPERGELDPASLDGVQAVVHLAGESVAHGRWTARKKARILGSRVSGTRILAEAVADMGRDAPALVCASATGYYGDRGDDLLSEEEPPGNDFLAGATRRWEASCQPAANAGARVVNLRLGVVFSRTGGALPRMLLPFRLGLGGRLGSGRQYISWITLDDTIRAVVHSIDTNVIKGPLNVAAPGPVTNGELTVALGRALSRPALLTVPAFALRTVLGEMANTLLASTRLDVSKLRRSGFEFQHPTIDKALAAVLS